MSNAKGLAKAEAQRFRNAAAMPSGPVALSLRNLLRNRSTSRVRTGKNEASPKCSGFNAVYSFVVTAGKADLLRKVSANSSARSFAVRAQVLSARNKGGTDELEDDLPWSALLSFHIFFDDEGKF